MRQVSVAFYIKVFDHCWRRFFRYANIEANLPTSLTKFRWKFRMAFPETNLSDRNSESIRWKNYSKCWIWVSKENHFKQFSLPQCWREIFSSNDVARSWKIFFESRCRSNLFDFFVKSLLHPWDHLIDFLSLKKCYDAEKTVKSCVKFSDDDSHFCTKFLIIFT